MKRSSRPNAAQHRPCTKPGDDGIPPTLLPPNRGEIQSGDADHGGPMSNQTSPLDHPLCDVSPRQPAEGEPELMIDTSQKEGQADLLLSGAGHHAESSAQDEPVRASGGVSNELAYLDARAHTLLEHCRQLLAPSSTPSDQVRRNVLIFFAARVR